MRFPKRPAAYILTDMNTGMFYIGSTVNLNARIASHRSKLRRGVHDNFRFQQIFSDWQNIEVTYYLRETIDAARTHEDALIKFHAGDELMLNIGTGAFSVWSGGMPEEYRELNRESSRNYASLPKNRERWSEYNRTRPREELLEVLKRARSMRGPVSDETRQRMSESWHRRGGISPETRKKMTEANSRREIHFTEEARRLQKKACQKPIEIEGMYYQSVTEAAKSLGIGQSTVSYRIKSKGFPNWRYGED